MSGYTCRTCGDEIPDIIALIDHHCDAILGAPSLSQQEQSTLLYIEERVVNNRGELDPEQMNWDDRSHIKLFTAAGLLATGAEDVVTEFTDAAWRLAGECRQLRAQRMIERDIDLGDPIDT